MGKKANGVPASEFLDGNDVPHVHRSDETDDKINLVARIVVDALGFASDAGDDDLISVPAALTLS